LKSVTNARSGRGLHTRRHTVGPTRTPKESTSGCRRAAQRLGAQTRPDQVRTGVTRNSATHRRRQATTTAIVELMCLSEAIIRRDRREMVR
jgi:hypothetical protein